VDIRGGPSRGGASNDSGVVRTGDVFCNFGHHIFGNFCGEANIIMRRHEVMNDVLNWRVQKEITKKTFNHL